MQLLDVNVLLAAHRGDHPLHPVARPWFNRLLAADESFTVPTVCWTSFLRLATHRRVFTVPTPLDEAFAFLDATCAQPHHLLLGPGPGHLGLVRRLCTEGGAVGDLVPDTVIGALALEHGCQVVTFDRDFARFPSVAHRLLRAG